MITYATACSGVESFSLAVDGMGMQALWFSEIEPHPCSVLAHHFPQVPNLGDMMRLRMYLDLDDIEPVDLFAAGTPCQAYSLAGLQDGLDDPRGQLTLEYVRICNSNDEALKRRNREPAVLFWENVPGVLADKTNAFGHLLAGLAGEDAPFQPPGKGWSKSGCVFGPQRAIAWRTLDAQYFGLAQRRKRVFLVASGRAGFDPAAVLFEFEGMRRDTPPGRGEGYDVTAVAADGAGSISRWPVDIAGTLTATYGDKQGLDHQHVKQGCDLFVPVLTITDNNVLTAMVSGGSTPGSKGSVSGRLGETYIVPCLTPWDTQRCRVYNLDGVSPSLVAPDGRGGCAPTVLAPGVAYPLRVRRLMPVECERLMGMPDNWTQVPYRGKPAEECADSPRYKAIGNSKAVPVVRWIAGRIKREMEYGDMGL